MALTFDIDAVSRRTLLRDGTLSIDKHFGVEVATCELWERATPGAGAYRPTLGQSLYVANGSELLFGGEIVQLEERAVWGASGTPAATIVTVTAKGYEIIADRVVIDGLSIASGDVLAIADDLFTTYLDPLGVTNIGATSGGPTVDALEIDHQTLSDVFNLLTQLSGYVWRINGDQEFAFVAPGALTGTGVTTSTAGNWQGARLDVQQSRVLRATRLFYRTGGSGTVTHSEARVGNGTLTTFLLNIEPSVIPTEVDENGTIYALPSATWTYNATIKAITRASALGNGVPVSVSYAVDLPAWGRVWDASTVASSGAWTGGTLVDAVINLSDQPDLAQATAWAREEMARRVAQPKVATIVTRTAGYYPLQEVTLSLSDVAATGDYLVQSVRIDVHDDDNITYALECIEGDTLGRAWFDYVKQRPGTTGGGVSVSGGTSGVGGGVSASAGVRIPLGGDNFRGDNVTDWTDVPNAVPLRFGGPAMAGTWTLRAYRRVKETTSPATTIEIRLRDLTNSVTLATASGTSSTTFLVSTTEFAGPLTEGVVLLQYRMVRSSGTPAEGIVGQCSLEKG